MTQTIIASVDSVTWFGFYATSNTPGTAPKLNVSLPRSFGNPPNDERDRMCRENVIWLGKNVEIKAKDYFATSGTVWADVQAESVSEVPF